MVMYLYMYVCECIYVGTHGCVDVLMNIGRHVYTYTWMGGCRQNYMSLCMYVSKYVCACIQVHTCMHTECN